MEQRTVPAWLAAPDRGPKKAKPFALLLLFIKFPFISPTANADAGYAHTQKNPLRFCSISTGVVLTCNKTTGKLLQRSQGSLSWKLGHSVLLIGRTSLKIINRGLPHSCHVTSILCSCIPPTPLPELPGGHSNISSIAWSTSSSLLSSSLHSRKQSS